MSGSVRDWMKKMKLVVNGDDGGAHVAGDQGLLKAAENGLLSSASVLVNGDNVQEFVKRAVDFGLGLGLHFNLSEGFPTGGPYKTLTDKSGRFIAPKPKAWETAAKGEYDPAEVSEEASLQWEALLNLGVDPDHLDSHNHIHIYPTVLQGLQQALGHKKNLFVRIPVEPECPAEKLPAMPDGKLTKNTIKKQSGDTQWKFSDRFIGFIFSFNPVAASIAHLKQRCPGTTEWMVHLSCRPGTSFTMDVRRDMELNFICSKETAEWIKEMGYYIGRFRDQV